MTDHPAAGEGPELFVGLVGATGTDMGKVERTLADAFDRVGYATVLLRVIDLLRVIPGFDFPDTPEDDRLTKAMDAGDRFRAAVERNDALALLAAARLAEGRHEVTGNAETPRRRTAYILRGLKRPEEIDTLRRIYGPNFLAIGAFEPRESRVRRLAEKIARSRQHFHADGFREQAEQLVVRDQQDPQRVHGQRLGDAFAKVDAFVRADNDQQLKTSVTRFVELVFGHPYHTPTPDELGMFLAHAAALRSAALPRQVGAAITTVDGSMVAVGCNDVPRAGGGIYWCTDERDGRDFLRGEESSDVSRQLMAEDIIKRLARAGWLNAGTMAQPIPDLARTALSSRDLFRGAHFDAVLEFGRIVHAEMAAITDAARRGVATARTTLYTTTFPCHNCARHIVAAGIARVVFIEPYPKSRALDLHADSIALEGTGQCDGKVSFEPFVGVAPRLFDDFFTMPMRVDKFGRTVATPGAGAQPRLASRSAAYLSEEATELRNLRSILETLGISSSSGGAQ